MFSCDVKVSRVAAIRLLATVSGRDSASQTRLALWDWKDVNGSFGVKRGSHRVDSLQQLPTARCDGPSVTGGAFEYARLDVGRAQCSDARLDDRPAPKGLHRCPRTGKMRRITSALFSAG